MINEIHINPPVATYQNPARLSDLRPINYIFGANGASQSTILEALSIFFDSGDVKANKSDMNGFNLAVGVG